MHASVSKYRVLDADAFVQNVQNEFVEQVKTIEGFVAYYVIDGGDGTVSAITVGEDEDAIEASIVQAQHWIVEKAAHLVDGAPDTTVGRVRVRAER